MESAAVTVTVEVTKERIRDILVTAFEGGVGYWCKIDGYECPTGTSVRDFQHPHCDLPVDGGAVLIKPAEDGDPEEFGLIRIDEAAIRRGLQQMATAQPGHFRDLIDENDDAETGDVFLQFCAFGEVIYG